VIYGGFVVGSKTQDHGAQKHQPWTEMQQPWMHANIAGDPLFYTQPTQQPIVVYPNDEEGLQEGEDTLGPDQAVVTGAGVGVGNKKGESHRTFGFIDKEDEVLYVSCLAVRKDSINGAQQKGQSYWHKFSQDYNERKLHKPLAIISNRNDESIKKDRPTSSKRRTSSMPRSTMFLPTRRAAHALSPFYLCTYLVKT
jgi:hypothetical protein